MFKLVGNANVYKAGVSSGTLWTSKPISDIIDLWALDNLNVWYISDIGQGRDLRGSGFHQVWEDILYDEKHG